MSRQLIELTATEAVTLLRQREVSPLELVNAAAERIEAVEPLVHALPTRCIARARDHAKRLMQDAGAAADVPGWLGGLPVAIKDLDDVAGVRTTYGSPLYRDHVPAASDPLVQRIERLGGIVVAKSNTPEFGAGGTTFNEVFERTCNPWNTSLTPGGSSGGAAVALATGECWLAQGSDHGGSLRRPATFCGVVGMRPTPGRVTRGTVDTLYSALTVQGPMARTVADLALFLDTMAGWCPHDPLTYDAPALSYASAVATADGGRPLRVAFSADYGGQVPVDTETRDICSREVLRFQDLGWSVDECSLDLSGLADAFMLLRSQEFVVKREAQLLAHRDQLKPDIVWNTERGLAATPGQLAWAERRRAAWFRQMAALFSRYDVFVLPGDATPAFDVTLRMQDTIDGKTLDHYLAGSMMTASLTLAGGPVVSVPCGLDRHGRPVGLQITGPPRSEARVLAAAALFERSGGFSRQLPIFPRAGAVPA